MNESPLNDIIFDSKIWKKDSQDEKEESLNNTIQNKKAKNKKSSKSNSYNSSINNSNGTNSNNTNSNNSENNNNSININNIVNNKQKNNKININAKKLTLPISSIPYSLKIKKDKINNMIIKKPLETKKILQNLPTFNYKSKEQSSSAFDKIKEKFSKNKKINIKNKTKDKKNIKKNTDLINIMNKKGLNKEKKQEESNAFIQINQIQTNNNNDEPKNDNNDEIEEFEDDKDNEVLQINKVASIDIKSNFMNNKYFSSNNPYFSNSINSNNNSNNSLSKQMCYTESDDSYNRSSSLFDPPSGRSNNSGNTFLTTNSYQGNNTDRYPYSSRFQFANTFNYQNYNTNNSNNNSNNNNIFYPRKNMALMGSFLSTGANSYSHSGQRYDTSNSNESGQSPHNFNVLQRTLSNNNLNNINVNNNINTGVNNNINNNINNNNIQGNYMMQINPLERQIYSSNCKSNELVFKQPFSINTSFYYKNNKGNLFSSNSEPKEKQIIKLEDIARGIEKRTTVMIRNVPIKYTVEVLEKELEYFNGKFDCIYMPFDYENGGNKGYAFLNLVNPYHVLLFYEFFQGKCWSFFESKKICELNFANFQGINEIKKHAKNYKGTKKPTFYINTGINNTNIEVPKKYLNLILEKNPCLKYYENKLFNTIIIKSFD